MNDDKPKIFTEEEKQKAAELAKNCNRHFVDWSDFEKNKDQNGERDE